MRVVAGFAEHPGAEDGSQVGWDRYISASGCWPKMRLHLPLEDFDLLVEGGDDRDQGALKRAYDGEGRLLGLYEKCVRGR